MTVVVKQTDDIATCLHLRRVVFIDEQNVPEAEEIDDLDDASLHLLALADDEAIGTARITISNGIAKIGRVCVTKPFRGKGIGEALIKAAIDLSRAEGATQAKLGAQVHALGFYENLGFAAFGPVYDDAGISHQDMKREL